MNEQIFFFFYNFAHKSGLMDKVIVFLAKDLPYLVILGAGVFLLMHHEVFKAESTFQIFLQKKKEIFRAFVVGVLAWVLAYGLKIILQFPRPFDAYNNVRALIPENDYAFPSGHATFFMALAFSVFFFHKKAGYVFMALAVVIGLSRIMAGVHTPVDILAGFALGGIVAYFTRNV